MKVAMMRKEIFIVIAEIFPGWLPCIPHFGGGSKPICFIFSKLFLENESQNRKLETDFETCVSFFQIHSATFRESNLITVVTVSSILHFTLHENIPDLMGICSTQSMRND